MSAFAKLPINLAGEVAYRLAAVEDLPHEVRSHIHAHQCDRPVIADACGPPRTSH